MSGDVDMHQHMCERDPEIEALQKQVEKLNEYPVVIATLEANSNHTRQTVDSLCIEIRKLTDVMNALTIAQVGMQNEIAKQNDIRAEMRELVIKLGRSKEDIDSEMMKCSDSCANKMSAVGSRLGGLETVVLGKGGEGGHTARIQDLEHIALVAKWVVGIITTALLLWGCWIVGNMFSHVFIRTASAVAFHIFL